MCKEEQPWWKSEQFLASLDCNAPSKTPVLPSVYWEILSTAGNLAIPPSHASLPASQPKRGRRWHSAGLASLCLDHIHLQREACRRKSLSLILVELRRGLILLLISVERRWGWGFVCFAFIFILLCLTRRSYHIACVIRLPGCFLSLFLSSLLQEEAVEMLRGSSDPLHVSSLTQKLSKSWTLAL